MLEFNKVLIRDFSSTRSSWPGQQFSATFIGLGDDLFTDIQVTLRLLRVGCKVGLGLLAHFLNFSDFGID